MEVNAGINCFCLSHRIGNEISGSGSELELSNNVTRIFH